jgi:hypothetical protein
VVERRTRSGSVAPLEALVRADQVGDSDAARDGAPGTATQVVEKVLATRQDREAIPRQREQRRDPVTRSRGLLLHVPDRREPVRHGDHVLGRRGYLRVLQYQRQVGRVRQRPVMAEEGVEVRLVACGRSAEDRGRSRLGGVAGERRRHGGLRRRDTDDDGHPAARLLDDHARQPLALVDRELRRLAPTAHAREPVRPGVDEVVDQSSNGDLVDGTVLVERRVDDRDDSVQGLFHGLHLRWCEARTMVRSRASSATQRMVPLAAMGRMASITPPRCATT